MNLMNRWIEYEQLKFHKGEDLAQLIVLDLLVTVQFLINGHDKLK